MQRRFLIQLVIQNQVPWAQSKTRQQNGKGSVPAFTDTDGDATIQLTVRQLGHASKCITHKKTFSKQTNIVKRFSTLFFFYGEIIFRSCPKKKKICPIPQTIQKQNTKKNNSNNKKNFTSWYMFPLKKKKSFFPSSCLMTSYLEEQYSWWS